ncbi:GTPase Era [Oleiphilus sp. HI0125]|uniref:GTPase Era n=1 Tax=Oleiphilus sp. HI0125 TaxID=1822266 RepID=UPI0009ED5C22|nr:GTPase Era [Oleiphilus sp. HI0125]
MSDKKLGDNDAAQSADELDALLGQAFGGVVQKHNTRCGYVAIVGRPNVGKSTLMNHILGQKLSITSRRPQTTRHQILGIKTNGANQAVYVDTPGLHLKEHKAINRYMNKAASSSLTDVDVVVFVVDRTYWTDDDDLVLEKLQNVCAPVILCINKVDRTKDKGGLLPYLQEISKKGEFQDIVPISAKQGHNVEQLESLIEELLPESMHYFPDSQVTDKSQRFLAAELVREKIMRQLGEELPYSVTVEIEEFKQKRNILHISALILVERSGQKKIVIGDKGEQIKIIGRDARKDMERMFDSKVMLNLWVKVKGGWSDDERALKSLGYRDQ